MNKIMKLAIVICAVLIPIRLHAAYEYENILNTEIDAPILDVSTNPAEGLIFVLTPGEILIYSMNNQAVLDRIPVDNQCDRIAFYNDDKLVITSTKLSQINVLRFSRLYDINLTGRAMKGPPKAKVTLVVFDDYQCPYCARLDRYVQQLLDQFPEDLNIVIKHFPISSHQFSNQGAMAALAAGEQSKFWEFHTKLLENYKQLNEEKIIAIAGEVGLDMDQFNQDRKSDSLRQVIREDMQNGRQIGVSGTPAVFINGKRVNNKDLRALSGLIRRELNKGFDQTVNE